MKMIKASIRKLRSSTKELMNAVDHGQSVIITNRGKACAKIVPVGEREKPWEEDSLFGMWKDHQEVKSVGDLIDQLRESRYAR